MAIRGSGNRTVLDPAFFRAFPKLAVVLPVLIAGISGCMTLDSGADDAPMAEPASAPPVNEHVSKPAGGFGTVPDSESIRPWTGNLSALTGSCNIYQDSCKARIWFVSSNGELAGWLCFPTIQQYDEAELHQNTKVEVSVGDVCPTPMPDGTSGRELTYINDNV